MNNKRIIINGISLIDGFSKEIKERTSIIIDGTTISDIGIQIPDFSSENDVVINGTGKYAMPGMIDCHLHLSGIIDADPLEMLLQNDLQQAMVSTIEAQELVQHGVTAVSEVSKNGVYLKELISSGIIEGPCIMANGLGLCRTGGYSDPLGLPISLLENSHPWAVFCDGEDDIRKTVRRLIRTNVDAIKVWATGGGADLARGYEDQHYTHSELKTVVEEANYVGIPVFAHCESLTGTKAALNAGIKRIVHGEDLDEECIEMMLKFDAYYIPTLKLNLEWHKYFTDENDNESKIEEELFRTIKSYEMALEGKVKIAIGSDTFCNDITPYGKYTIDEIKTLVKYGMKPWDAISSATQIGSSVLNKSSVVGTIEEGKQADIIILDKNPLENIEHLNKENMFAIIKKGKLIS